MGLRMDIHEPSVPSNENSSAGAANRDRKSVLELISEKDKLEGELSALGGTLESHGVDMNTSLITSDGFPRNDLDIAQIRTTRARIIRLQNDYKNLMSRIEAGLHDHFARSKDQTTSPTNLQPVSSLNVPIQGGSNAVGEEEGYGVAAFAKVNSVVSGSPADQAGLEAGDEILLFGDINWLNHEKLAGVARTVQRNEGLRVRVKVSRQDTNGVREEHNLELIPRSNWGGRGLLGCHLLPL